MISQKQKAPKRTLKEELQVNGAKLPLSLSAFGELSLYDVRTFDDLLWCRCFGTELAQKITRINLSPGQRETTEQ